MSLCDEAVGGLRGRREQGAMFGQPLQQARKVSLAVRMVGLFQPGNIGAVGNDGVEQGCLPAAVAFVGGANLAFQAAKTPALARTSGVSGTRVAGSVERGGSRSIKKK